MTQPAVGFGRGFPRAWLVPILALVLVLGLAVFGVFSRSIVADLVAWWPVWLGLGVLAFIFRDRQFGAVRAAGLIPFVALVTVGLFTWGHMAGWAIMPSASQRLVGPEVADTTSASLQASIDGEIQIGLGDGALYRVDPIRRGGSIAVASATEHVEGTEVDVVLTAPSDPGIYSYSGWIVELHPDPLWGLDLDGVISADLTGLSIASLELSGNGTTELGDPGGAATVTVTGSHRIAVPGGAPVTVVGVASVPASWTLTESGASSPTEGEGWTITVVGEATVAVVER